MPNKTIINKKRKVKIMINYLHDFYQAKYSHHIYPGCAITRSGVRE